MLLFAPLLTYIFTLFVLKPPASLFAATGMPKRILTSIPLLMASINPSFRVTTAQEARSLTDGVKLKNTQVVLPWVGYGTYKLGKSHSRECTLEALRRGYRCLDTAFIYAGETTELQVGMALQDAIHENLIQREDVVVITKHWRKYHGYDNTMENLRLSCLRLQLDFIDLWLMHWPVSEYNLSCLPALLLRVLTLFGLVFSSFETGSCLQHNGTEQRNLKRERSLVLRTPDRRGPPSSS
jgi:hypothetical protein